jgi:(4-O-methyl)-D-glucuronate---lignin esterase
MMTRTICVWAGLPAWLMICSLAAQATAEEETFNYDEAKVPAYTLPGLLKTRDGRAVTSADAWRKERRGELLELFRQNVYGRRPPEPRMTRFHASESTPDYLHGKGKRKLVRALWITPEGPVPMLSLTILVPTAAPRPVPAFVGVHLFDTASPDPIPGKLLDADVGVPLPGKRILDVILERGYAIATLNAEDFCPDDKEKFRQGVLAVMYPDRSGPPGAEEPGAIATWAWGLSRALDYIEQDPEIDQRRVAVIGHSRMGKTALWAGAEDERFALVISNDSGCGGAALSRRRFGETVSRINRVFPHWFCDNFKGYNDHEDQLPVDQHELMALIAPRPVYVASAQEDGWADPRGEFLAALAAEPAYRLFGLAGLETSEPPPLNQSIGDFVGYHRRAGKHALTDFDWLKYLDFADRHFGKGAAQTGNSRGVSYRSGSVITCV